MARLLAYLVEIVVLLLVLRRLLGGLLVLLGRRQTRVWTGRSGSTERSAKEVVGGQTARDPVCGMFVSTELSTILTLDGQTFHFCSRECLERYQKTHA